MIPELGHFALIVALLAALALGTLPLVGAARSDLALMAMARPAARMLFVLVAFAFGCLAWSFITSDFSVENVAQHSNSRLPVYYRFAATWGSHEGSLLLWLLMLTGWAGAVTLFSRNLPAAIVARVLAIMGLIAVGFLILGHHSFRLVNLIREPFLLAFSTASSEAAYPKTMEQLEKFPISKKIISFVLPMGYSFNLDGSMMYCTFATLFIAQAYNIELPLGQQITMLLLLMLTSKGMAGVPRASLVVIAATLASFNIPEAGLLLIIGIDQFLDMGRSATNVIGNTLATAAIAKWEGERVDLAKLEAALAPKAA